VFLTDAVVPAGNVIGEVDDGWRVTLTTLANERNRIGSNARGGGAKHDIHEHPLHVRIRELMMDETAGVADPSAKVRGFTLLLELARQRGALDDPLVRQELARTYVNHEVARISTLRVQAAAEAAKRGGPAGQAASIVSTQKLVASMNLHRLGRAALDVEGAYGMLAGDDALLEDRAFETMAMAFIISIGGGTDQIQRNIIGERVLGLPGDVRDDKEIAFSELPTSGTASAR
jgi:alkylation response protein AidB-like acyl-CoA dehydrogenase